MQFIRLTTKKHPAISTPKKLTVRKRVILYTNLLLVRTQQNIATSYHCNTAERHNILTHSGDIRDRTLKLSEIGPNFARFEPPISLGGWAPEFLDLLIKRTQIAIMWQSFTAIGRGSSEVARRKKIKEKKHLQ